MAMTIKSISLIIVILLITPSTQATVEELAQRQPPTFTLVGTIVSGNSQAFALIKTQKIHFYTLGETINAFTLKAIYHNSIQVTRENKSYTLHLQHKTNEVAYKSSEAASLAPPSETYMPLKRELLQHIRNNTQKWLSAITFSMQVTEGLMSGYIIESIGKIPLNSSIGLEEGDVIKAINGIPIGQSELFAKTVNNLLSANEISMLIERDHKTHIINFNISE